MTHYSAGFLISEDKTRVAMICKNRPDWQRGKLNGIGGHIEGDECSVQTMVREFQEETGVQTSVNQWRFFCTLRGEKFKVFWYTTTGTYDIKTTTDEVVSWVLIDDVINGRVPTIPNIKWLLLLALDKDNVIADVLEN